MEVEAEDGDGDEVVLELLEVVDVPTGRYVIGGHYHRIDVANWSKLCKGLVNLGLFLPDTEGSASIASYM